MAGYLTTHVLDTSNGKPAEGLLIDLYRLDGETRTHLRSLKTNSDGRTDEQILPAEEFALGTYELVFHTGAYLDATRVPDESPRFLDAIPAPMRSTINSMNNRAFGSWRRRWVNRHAI